MKLYPIEMNSGGNSHLNKKESRRQAKFILHTGKYQ